MTRGPYDPARATVGRTGMPHPRGPMSGQRETRRNTRLDTLLVQVAAGDTAAFEELYDEIIASVYGLAVRVLHDPAQAEEIAQEVLVEIWRKAGRYDPARGGALGWIMT